MPDTSPAPGLRAEKQQVRGWLIIHEQSDKSLGLWLRLRRHAEAAITDLAATGEDFTLTRDQLQEHAHRQRPESRAVGAVLRKWQQRQIGCCEDGEHYSPHTRAAEGRCTGDNGQPRRP